MKLSTKTVASLLVISSVAAAVPGISRLVRPIKKHNSQFDKILQRHDRKGEIRAELLGISSLEFRSMQKKHSFSQIVTKCGFTSVRAFRFALVGRLRNELLARGWSHSQIDSYVMIRSARFA